MSNEQTDSGTNIKTVAALVSNIPAWNGARLCAKAVAIAFSTADARQQECWALIAVTEQTGPLLVSSGVAGQFLRQLKGKWVACQDAADLHGKLSEFFETRGDKRGKKCLWRLSQRCRLIDVGLFDRRLRLLTSQIYPRQRSLSEMAEYYLGRDSQAGFEGHFTDESEALTIFKIFAREYDEANKMLRCIRIPKKLWRRFGPLGLGIEVQGAIASLVASRRGIKVDAQKAQELHGAAQRSIRMQSDVLKKESRDRAQFKWANDQVAIRADESYWSDAQSSRIWAKQLLTRARGFNDVQLVPPADDDGQLTVEPELWQDLVLFHPSLLAWRDLDRAAQLQVWLPMISNSWQAHPRYTNLPRFGSIQPDLSVVRQLCPGVFKPRSGKSLLIVELRDLELRCWAAVCNQRYPSGFCIAQMFMDGDDAVAQTAARMSELDPQRLGDLNQLDFLKSLDGDLMLRLSRILLIGFARNQTAEQLKLIIRQRLPELDLGTSIVTQLREYILAIYSEMEVLFSNDITQVLATHLRISETYLCEQFPRHDPSTELPVALQDALEHPKRHSQTVNKLHQISNNQRFNALIDEEGRSLYAALAEWPVTASGGAGHYQFGLQRHTVSCVASADEVRMAVAYGLVVADYQLVAMAGDEFVLEIDKISEVDLERLERIVNNRIKALIGLFATNCFGWRQSDRW